VAKKIKYSDLKTKSLFSPVDEPILGEKDALLAAQSQSFEGESSNDAGLAFGMDQYRNRAYNQPVLDQLANAAAKTLPGVALGIVENFGYLGELLSRDQDYNNAFTEIARNSRDWLENKLPVYRENPNEVFDLGNSAWWINHGQGLVESVGEFLVTGAGVGKGLSTGAKALGKVLKTGELGNKVLQGAAQLGTASSLAYTEGAMSGARVYKDVYNEVLTKGHDYGDGIKVPVDENEAVRIASQAASETVRLNTVLNTGLNLTSIAPLFKSFGHLDDAVKSGLSRKAKESTADYIKRLTLLETQGIPQASVAKKLALEAFQEGTEEEVNLFAEQEGYITGGLKKQRGSGLDRFFENALSEEGALNFILGAVGGVAQTAGMEYAPINTIQTPEGERRISNRALEQKEKLDYQKFTVSTLKDDIQTIQDNQQALNDAVASGDKVAVQTARNNLFNVGLLKSLRTETAKELSKEIAQVAQVDNTEILENGATAAMNAGLADNIDDNKYKETAARKASDVLLLNKEYRDLISNLEKPALATEVFKKRLNVYSYESALTDLQSDLQKSNVKLSQLIPDVNLLDAVKLKSEILAYDQAISYLNKQGKTEQAARVESESKIAKELYKQNLELTGTTDEQVEANKGVYKELADNQTAELVLKQGLIDTKKAYNEALADPEKESRELNKKIADLTRKAEEAQKTKEAEAVKVKREQDFQEAKAKEVVNQVVDSPVVDDGTEDTLDNDTDISITLGEGEDKKADIERRRQEELNDAIKGLTDQINTWEEIEAYTGAKTMGEAFDAIYEIADKAGRVKREQGVTGTRADYTFTEQEQRFIDFINRYLNPLVSEEPISQSIQELKNRKEKAFNSRSGNNRTAKINAKYDAELAALNENLPPIDVGVIQVESLTPITVTYLPLTEKERVQELNTIDANLINLDNLNNTSYGEHNKLAYKAQEQTNEGKTVDPSVINDSYKILHDPVFNTGVDVVLKIATESPYYQKNKDSIKTVPIGVYYKGNLIGYLPVYRDQNKALFTIRSYVSEHKEVKTTVSKKTPGNLNFSTKDFTTNNYVKTPTFVIGRGQQYEQGVDNVFKGKLVNKGSALSGVVYAVSQTPIGENIALPVDPQKVGAELAESMQAILNLYFKGARKDTPASHTEEEQRLIKQLQEEYSIDPSTFKGLLEYFNLFYYGTNLNPETNEGQRNIETIGRDFQRNNHYVEVSTRGIRYMKSGGIVEDYGRNDVEDTEKTTRLVEHLTNAYAKIDLNKINKNGEFKAPILNTKSATYTRYTKANYNEYVASVTKTNIKEVSIGNNKATVLVQPTIYLDYSFMNAPKETLTPVTEEGQKVVSLASKKGADISLLDDFDDNEYQPKGENLTEEERREFQKKCLE
jgi:hypothetical protein